MKKIHILCLGFLLLVSSTYAQTYFIVHPEKVPAIIDSLKVQQDKVGPAATKYWDRVLFQEWSSSDGVHKIALDRKNPTKIFIIQLMKNSPCKRSEIVISGDNFRMSINRKGQVSFAHIAGVAHYIFQKNGNSIKSGDTRKLEYYFALAADYFKRQYP